MATAVSVSASPHPGKALHIGLWSAQIVLALLFGMAGLMKSTTPAAELVAQMGWPGAMSIGMVRFIGISELAGALGLILPAATRIKPGLTVLAAAGLVVVMGLAAAFHLSRGEYAAIATNLALGSLAAFVAWGRSKRVPIAPRG